MREYNYRSGRREVPILNQRGWKDRRQDESPHRQLLLASMNATVEILRAWCRNWRSWKADMGRRGFRNQLEICAQADEWLTSDHRGDVKLSFIDMCELCDLDPVEFREEIYAQFDRDAIDALWRMSGTARGC